MSQSLMQHVLGDDWDLLPRVIQRHYHIIDKQSSCLYGSMDIDFPSYLFPLIWLIHLFGGLVLWRGAGVTVEVVKYADTDNNLNWRRTMTYRDGRVDYFISQMQCSGEHELVETIGFGFGLKLKVDVIDGDLVYLSNGHFWQSGRLRINLPDWLLLGSAVIREHAVSEDSFYLDFSIRHPFLGVTYFYRGEFCYE